jgi:hypothetical protein
MATLSLASDLAWRFAAYEALARGSAVLEPGDLLVGILSIEKVFSPELAAMLRITEYGLSTVRVEWQEILRAAATAVAGPAVLRRSIRDEMPHHGKEVDKGKSAKPKVSRSAASKAAFTRAGELAETAGSTVVGIRYLLFAALEGASADFSQSLFDQLLRVKMAISPLVHQPLHTSISKLEQGYVSDAAIAPTIDRRRAKG